MIEQTFIVNKANVYNEVAKTTSYTGAKMEEDAAYQRIFTKDEDRLMLERFWNETCNAATDQLKQFIKSVSSQTMDTTIHLDENYEVTLELSSSYDTNLTGSAQTSLFSFFVSSIVSKWFKFTNKQETDSYVQEAVGLMNDVISKIYWKKKPTRVIPTN